MTQLTREQWVAIAALFQSSRNEAMTYRDSCAMRVVQYLDLLENHLYNLVAPEQQSPEVRHVGGLTEAQHALLDDMDMLAIELNRSVGTQVEAARLRDLVNRAENAMRRDRDISYGYRWR